MTKILGMDPATVQFYLDLAQWIFIGGLAVWGYLRTADSNNETAVKKVADELAAFIKASGAANEQQNIRLTTLEEAMNHMPTDEEIGRMGQDIASLKAQVNGVSALLSRVEHQTTLIHQHLLNKR